MVLSEDESNPLKKGPSTLGCLFSEFSSYSLKSNPGISDSDVYFLNIARNEADALGICNMEQAIKLAVTAISDGGSDKKNLSYKDSSHKNRPTAVTADTLDVLFIVFDLSSILLYLHGVPWVVMSHDEMASFEHFSKVCMAQ